MESWKWQWFDSLGGWWSKIKFDRRPSFDVVGVGVAPMPKARAPLPMPLSPPKNSASSTQTATGTTSSSSSSTTSSMMSVPTRTANDQVDVSAIDQDHRKKTTAFRQSKKKGRGNEKHTQPYLRPKQDFIQFCKIDGSDGKSYFRGVPHCED